MRYLLDSHVLLWFCNGDRRLSRSAVRTLEDPDGVPIISIASVFELSAKAARTSLHLDSPVSTFAQRFVDSNHGELLPILLVHCTKIEVLPLVHRDPFDRMLIAQAIVESLPLVTGDPEFEKYGVKVIW